MRFILKYALRFVNNIKKLQCSRNIVTNKSKVKRNIEVKLVKYNNEAKIKYKIKVKYKC